MALVQSSATASVSSGGGARYSRWLFGDADRPRWERPGLLALLAGTAVLYLWALDSMGWANEFYAAAVQSGTQNWKALLFGSLDPGNAITVDKPPASTWVMALSGRIFGFSTWSMLVPQALMGVASVSLLSGAVRRTNGPAAGLLAGVALALTPVVALMFRFNNPDALLVFLLVLAGYCAVRALHGSPTLWIAFAGVAMGFAFLAKLMQALLVTPALALVVLVALPGSMWKRVGSVLVGVVAMVLSAGWFIALVSLWPADSRPYIGGSKNNSLLELAVGYNGLGRVLGGTGNPTQSASHGGDHGGPMFSGNIVGGNTGLYRMFGQLVGGEISWLLPAALIGLVAGLWCTRRAPRTSMARAGLLLWGGWMGVTMLTFSFMKGIMHPYYTVALAPGIAAVIGISVAELWRARRVGGRRIVLGLMLIATGVWSFVLLNRTSDWLPWLRWVLLAGSIFVAAVLIVGGRRLDRYAAGLATAGLLFGLGGSAIYTIETVLHGHGGPLPTSGPPRAGGPLGDLGDFGAWSQTASSPQLQSLLTSCDKSWAAATVGSQLAGSLELDTGASIMAVGGYSGGDDSPTLVQFQRYVADDQIGYFVMGTGHGPGGSVFGSHRTNAASQISDWVKANFPATTVGGVTVFELSAP